MIVVLTCLAVLLPLNGVIGIPLSRRGVHVGGLTVSGEMYGAAIYLRDQQHPLVFFWLRVI